LLRLANGNGSPRTLGELHRKAMEEGSGPGPMSTDRTEALVRIFSPPMPRNPDPPRVRHSVRRLG
jgi:hypothetical protein